MACSCKNKNKVVAEVKETDQFLKLKTNSFNISTKKDYVDSIVEMVNK